MVFLISVLLGVVVSMSMSSTSSTSPITGFCGLPLYVLTFFEVFFPSVQSTNFIFNFSFLSITAVSVLGLWLLRIVISVYNVFICC